MDFLPNNIQTVLFNAKLGIKDTAVLLKVLHVQTFNAFPL